VLKAGEATGDVSERDIRRIQIRETIKAHFDKEKQLFRAGHQVLSLFFIDEVVKYRTTPEPMRRAIMPASSKRNMAAQGGISGRIGAG